MHRLAKATVHRRLVLPALLLSLAVFSAAEIRADEGSVPANGTIAYVMIDLFWAVYQTPDGKTECPRGFNDGPREQFEALFPDGSVRTVVDTQLQQEIETWHPTAEPDTLPFFEVEVQTYEQLE